jgi:hypothetical protein
MRSFVFVLLASLTVVALACGIEARSIPCDQDPCQPRCFGPAYCQHQDVCTHDPCQPGCSPGASFCTDAGGD